MGVQLSWYDDDVMSQIRSGEIIIDPVAGRVLSTQRDLSGYQATIGWVNCNGHLLFGFRDRENGVQRNYYACRAVWMAYFGMVPEGKIVSHKDDNKSDNRIDNLYLTEPTKKFHPRGWTANETDWLIANKGQYSLVEMAKQLGRSIKSVRHKIKSLMLPSREKQKIRWTDADDKLIQELHEQQLTVNEIAARMDRSVAAVRLRCNRKFGAFRSDKHLVSDLKSSKNFYLSLKQAIVRGSAGAKCCLCDYSKYIDLHHIDSNRHNNCIVNIASLCPNHHREITAGGHADIPLCCIWWRKYSDGSISSVYNNLPADIKLIADI